jgi:protein-S-isoprenylcysteine O-methyltransferase Ste14
VESESIFRAIFFVLLVAVIAIRIYYGWRIGRTGESGWSVKAEAVEREGRWSILLRIVLALFSVAAIILYAVNPGWLGTFAIPLPPWSQWFGVGLGAAGLILLAWVHHTLGRLWSTSLQLKEEHTLVTSGPYRWARHPMYTALFGFFAGLVLVSASWLVVVLVAVAIFVLYTRVGE